MNKQHSVHFPNQRFEVWHYKPWQPLFFADSEENFINRAIFNWLNNHKRFVKVAEVEASDLDEVWTITHNYDDSWTKRSAVKWSKSSKVEDISIGDVIVHNGKAWLYVWGGFMEVVKNKAKP